MIATLSLFDLIMMVFSVESRRLLFLNVTSNRLVTVARNGRQTIAVMVGIALRARADIYAVKLRWFFFSCVCPDALACNYVTRHLFYNFLLMDDTP